MRQLQRHPHVEVQVIAMTSSKGHHVHGLGTVIQATSHLPVAESGKIRRPEKVDIVLSREIDIEGQRNGWVTEGRGRARGWSWSWSRSPEGRGSSDMNYTSRGWSLCGLWYGSRHCGGQGGRHGGGQGGGGGRGHGDNAEEVRNTHERLVQKTLEASIIMDAMLADSSVKVVVVTVAVVVTVPMTVASVLGLGQHGRGVVH